MRSITIAAMIIMISISGISQNKNLHGFKVKAIDGSEFDMATLKGKKVMIVNTASKCGFTPQYKTLQELYERYGGENFEIIGFPANNFMKQEPGTNAEIQQFCSINYGVTFPMMEKVSVKGKDIHPLFRWLTEKTENGKMNAKVKWNFQKFLIDESGNLVDYLLPVTRPDDRKVLKWLSE